MANPYPLPVSHTVFSLTYGVNELWSPSASRMLAAENQGPSVFPVTGFLFLVPKTHNKYFFNKFLSKTPSILHKSSEPLRYIDVAI